MINPQGLRKPANAHWVWKSINLPARHRSRLIWIGHGQLQRDYKEEDIHSAGLMIFTSMDPITQLTAETILQKRVAQLERSQGIKKGKLNGALIISSVQGGEVVALVGSRDVRYAGYNRALTAQRQIGSLVKPAIYLTAFEQKNKYNLGTRISDGPVTVKIDKRKYWQPGNYDQRHMVYYRAESTTLSRNTPAVRIKLISAWIMLSAARP